MIYTEQEIDDIAIKVKGTWVKRRNMRNRLKQQSNSEVREKIEECKGKIRDLRAMGAREKALRDWYAEITKYELMLLE
jgi:hypothetical protein